MNIFRGSRGTSLQRTEKLIGGAAIAIAFALALAAATSMIGSQVAGAYPAGWSLQQRIEPVDVAQCDITAWQNHVWVVWRKSNGAILIRHSADYGATWSAYKYIENGAFQTNAPVVVVGGSGTNPTARIYVIYGSKREGGGYLQTWIARSDDLGENWQTTSERWHSSGVGNKTRHAACRYPVSHVVEFAFVAPDPGSNKEEVYTGEIHTDGQIGIRTVPLSKNDGIESSYPVIACDGYANAMVVWQDGAGGSYERPHLMYAHTTDKGVNWIKGSLPYSGDYEQMYPSMTWDQNPVLACMGKNVKNGVHHVGRYTFDTPLRRWLPDSVGESITALNSDIATIPAVNGRHDGDVYYRNASLRLTRGCSSAIGDILGNEAIPGGTKKIAVASSDPQNNSSIDYVAAVTSEGKLYVRRKDPVKPSVEVTSPKFGGNSPIYLNSDFSLKCENACDDFCVNGVDITTNVEYHKGLEGITYYYSLDDATWDFVPSTDSSISCLPPYEVKVDTSCLNGKGLRVKSVAVDSAGNKSAYVTPWIFVDLDAPTTSLRVSGTEGLDGFFRSDASLSFDVEDMANLRTEYRIESESGGTQENWTVYNAPFVLGEG
ncbi:MAG: sialidase family protein, partial [Actinomycetota bacterium]|nr:sialidase family protein [Actinomycetota bacterium]